MPVSAGRVPTTAFSSGSGFLLQKFNLAKQTAFNVHMTVFPEIEYTQELIYTGERFETTDTLIGLRVFVSILADDAEFAAGRRRPGASGECESASCYLLKISATKSRFS